MESKYGEFTDEQFSEFKKRLHGKIHWLLLYKEMNKCDILREYFDNTMLYVNSLNNLLNNNSNIVDMLVVLQTAREELDKEDFSFRLYRKNILEAHKIIDRL